MRQFADDAFAAAAWNLRRAPWAWIVGLNVFWIVIAELANVGPLMLAVTVGMLSGCVAAGAGMNVPLWLPLLALGAAAVGGTTWLVLASGWVVAVLLARFKRRPGFLGAIALLGAGVLAEPGFSASATDTNRAAWALFALGAVQLGRNGHSVRNGVALFVAYAAWMYAASWGNVYAYFGIQGQTWRLPVLLFVLGRIGEAARALPADDAAADRATVWMLEHPWRTTALGSVAALVLARAGDDPWWNAWQSHWEMGQALPSLGLLGLAFLFHLSRGSRTLLGEASVYCAVAATVVYAIAVDRVPTRPHAMAVFWLTPWLPIATGWIAGRRDPLQRFGALDALLAAGVVTLALVRDEWGDRQFVGISAFVGLLLFHRAVALGAPTRRLVAAGIALGVAGALTEGWYFFESIRWHELATCLTLHAAGGAFAALVVAAARRVRSMTPLPDDHPALDARPAVRG